MSDYDPGLDAIVRTDRFVDALAGGARMSSVDPLSAMLGAWRDEVRSQPDEHVITLAQASAALAQTQKPLRRNRVGLTVVGAAAAAVLCLGGFGAVVYDAGPGDALYGLRSMLFGESAPPRSDAVVLTAKELDQVQQLVNQGKWEEAQQKLVSIAPKVQSFDNTQSKQELVAQYNALTAKVIERNPEAAPPPPDAPPPPVNPQSPLSFLPVPVIETPTPSPSSIDPNLMISPPSSSTTSSSSSSTSASSSSSSTTSASPSSSSPSSSPSSSSPSPAPSSSSVPSSSPKPSSSSPAATPSSAVAASSSPKPSSPRVASPSPSAPASASLNQSASSQPSPSAAATPSVIVTSSAAQAVTPSAAASPTPAATPSAATPAPSQQPRPTPSAPASPKSPPVPTPTSQPEQGPIVR